MEQVKQVERNASIDRDAVLNAVDRIQASGLLGSGERSANLLRYIVIEELVGRGDRLKAYSIAIDVFGKNEDFDPSSNSLVRVEALRLRTALDQYYERFGKDDPLKIELHPGSYRPNFIWSKDFIESRKTKPAESPGGSIFGFGKLRPVLMVLLVSLVALALFKFSPWSFGGLNSERCASARPYVSVTFDNPNRYSDATLKQWQLTTKRYLAYYSSVTQSVTDAEACAGIPSYQLEITKPKLASEKILVSLTTDDGGFVWSKPYNNDEFITKKGENLALAKIAFDVGSTQGAIALDAGARTWGQQRAFDEFQCISRVHQFFAFNSAGQFDSAYQCLSELVKQRVNSADVYGLYAALLERKITDGKVLNDNELFRERDRAIETGESKDPFNSEILIARLRIARHEFPTQFAITAEILSLIDREFPMEPHLLNQAAITYAVRGEFEKSLEYSGRAEAIMGSFSSSYWPKLIANIGLARWSAAAPDIEKLKSVSNMDGQLLLLALSNELGDQESMKFAMDRLRDLGIDSPSQISGEIERLHYSQSLKDRLTQAILPNFAGIAS